MKRLTPTKFSIEELEITPHLFSYLFLTFWVITEISLQYLPQHTISFFHPDKNIAAKTSLDPKNLRPLFPLFIDIN